MADFEAAYNSFDSRFGESGAAMRRGSFSRFLDDAGPSGLAQFGGQTQNTFKPPASVNAAEQDAMGATADARNVEQWGANLNRVGQQHDQFSQLGINSVQQIQQVQQAKEMAKLNAQSARQGAMFSAISSGMSILGNIGSFGQSKGWFGGGSSTGTGNTYGLPSASNWSGGSSAFRYF